MADLTIWRASWPRCWAWQWPPRGATDRVAGMLGDENQGLRAALERMHDEAAETEERCTALAGSFDGKNTAILESARETRGEATEMMETYLGGEEDPLDGFEFLTMAEAGEVGHWSVVGKLNEQARNAAVAELVDWALPVQRRPSMTCWPGRSSSPPPRIRTRSPTDTSGPWLTGRVGGGQLDALHRG